MLIIGSMSIMVVPPGTDERTGESFYRLRDKYRLNVIFSERLAGKWGVTDVEDCVSAVFELGRAGLVDPKRVAIRGGSAGAFVPQAREGNGGILMCVVI
jgi:poly(3-hydroxybutyrate) depolymerase